MREKEEDRINLKKEEEGEKKRKVYGQEEKGKKKIISMSELISTTLE